MVKHWLDAVISILCNQTINDLQKIQYTRIFSGSLFFKWVTKSSTWQRRQTRPSRFLQFPKTFDTHRWNLIFPHHVRYSKWENISNTIIVCVLSNNVEYRFFSRGHWSDRWCVEINETYSLRFAIYLYCVIFELIWTESFSKQWKSFFILPFLNVYFGAISNCFW